MDWVLDDIKKPLLTIMEVTVLLPEHDNMPSYNFIKNKML